MEFSKFTFEQSAGYEISSKIEQDINNLCAFFVFVDFIKIFTEIKKMIQKFNFKSKYLVAG